jgi:hypothetical protein
VTEKSILEYAKLAILVAAVVAIVVGVFQWREGNRAALAAVYQRMTNEWRDHLKTFVEKPELRPYFEEKKVLAADDLNKEAVLAVADVRLDVMDAVLTTAAGQGYEDQIIAWRNTFSRAFRSSPALCARVQETASNYGLIVPISREVCE